MTASEGPNSNGYSSFSALGFPLGEVIQQSVGKKASSKARLQEPCLKVVGTQEHCHTKHMDVLSGENKIILRQ